MPDVESIAIARKKVGAAFTALLKDISDRQMSGRLEETHEQLPTSMLTPEVGVTMALTVSHWCGLSISDTTEMPKLGRHCFQPFLTPDACTGV